MRPLHKFLGACALSLFGVAGSLLAGPISVSELNYRPAGDGDEEYIELINTSATAYALNGCSFTTGITYTFGSLTLQPGARVVVCRDRTKFTARYGTIANLASGAYTGRFSDDGEAVVLTALNSTELFRFSFSPSGDWPSRANGLGSSLECLNPDGNLSSAANWRSSTEYHGNPGRAGIGPIRSVVVNEVLAHTDPLPAFQAHALPDPRPMGDPRQRLHRLLSVPVRLHLARRRR